MIFGNEKFRNILMGIINTIADENHFNIMYGTTLGSISRGIQRYDSDYDIKFFYSADLERKHIEKEKNWYSKWEDTAIHDLGERVNFDLLYDLAIWDIGSFFELLINPECKEREISPQLYFQVFHSLISPYHYDPYGITNKILPIVWNVYDINYLFVHYERYLKKRYYKGWKDGKMAIKEYLNMLQAILSMKWILKYDTVPPYYLQSLMYVCENEEIEKLTDSLYAQLKNDTYKLLDEMGNCERKSSKDICILQIDKMDNYLMCELNHNRAEWHEKENYYSQKITVEEQVRAVKQILSIIDASQKEEMVKGVTD